jgi:nuclear transport factor 2 (NTF2) superfamily protein
VRITDAGTPTILGADQQWEPFRPSTNWAHTGPIIERERISLDWDDDAGQWYAQVGHSTECGPTPLVAAMRAYVAMQR